jgi:hypothetical protein
MTILDELNFTPMTADDIAALRKAYGLSRKAIAASLGVAASTWSLWENFGAPEQWSFLLREWHDEAIDDIAPTTCPPGKVKAIREAAGGAKALQDVIGVHPTSVSVWCRTGAPGQKGYGRAFAVIAEIYGL